MPWRGYSFAPKVPWRRSLAQSLAANGATAAIMAGYQLASVPLLLRSWGPDFYGEWVVVSAIAAYFQITDVGLNTATANSLSFARMRGDSRTFNTLINNNILFLVVAFGTVAVLVRAGISAGLAEAVLRPGRMGAATMHAVLWLLFAQIFVGTLTNVLTGVYRAVDRYARGVTVDNLIRISEYVAFLGAVAGGARVTTAVFAALGVKIVGLVGKTVDARRLQTFPLDVRLCSRDDFLAQMRPALSFLLFPIGNAVALQGPVLLLNYFLGPVTVVMFTTTRTLVSLGRAPVDIIHRSLWPQMALAYGRSDAHEIARLHRITMRSSLGVVAVAAVALSGLGGTIYGLWVGTEPAFSPLLGAAFILSLVTGAVCGSAGLLLQATNEHIGLAKIYVLAAVLTVALSALLLSAFGLVETLPLALVAGDIGMTAYAQARVSQLIGAVAKEARQ